MHPRRMNSGLRRLQDGFPHRLRQANADEVIGGIEVILAGFVNAPDLFVGGCSIVGYDAANLPQFERGRILPVFYADHELWLCLFHQLIKNPLQREFFPADAVAFVPMCFCRAYRTIGKLNLSGAFALPPAAWAIDLAATRQLANGTAAGLVQ